MQTNLDSSKDNVYACQNCAARFHAPVYKEEPMVLLEDAGEYSWISRVDRKKIIPVEVCCELPYIQELEE